MIALMQPRRIPIQTLLLRAFLPAVAIIAIAIGGLTYTRLYDSILEGFDRKLITVSALTGALIDAADHDELIAIARSAPQDATAEQSPEYLRAVEPMRRIREALDITYLYSQILGGSQDIIYVLDASIGDEHSQIGAEDDLPAETLAGIKRSEKVGSVHLSPIEFQEQWGLLKTAAAPVRSADGRFVATAGADVNVSLIRVATQNALFTSVVIGMASLLACTLVVLLVVRRIGGPLDRLRNDALRIAGGDHSPPQPFPAPPDIARLQIGLAENAAEVTAGLDVARKAARLRSRAAGTAALEAGLERIADDAPHLAFTGDRVGIDDRLRAAAAALLAERIAADPALADELATRGPLIALAPGQSAQAILDDGRSIPIGAAS